MSGPYSVDVGDRGRLVIPEGLRRALGWEVGTRLHLLETDGGVVVMTRDQLKAHVRRDLAGIDLVSQLLADRRRAAAADLASDTSTG